MVKHPLLCSTEHFLCVTNESKTVDLINCKHRIKINLIASVLEVKIKQTPMFHDLEGLFSRDRYNLGEDTGGRSSKDRKTREVSL